MKHRLKLSCGWLLAGWLAGSAVAGTVSLVKDINPDEVIASSSPWFLGVAGDRAVFVGMKPHSPGGRLFRTDGTAAGTVEFTAAGLIHPGSPMKFGNRMLLTSVHDDTQQFHSRIWITDGTDAGTVMLLDLGNVNGGLDPLKADANRAWFCAVEHLVTACDLFVTDGTVAGTRRLTTNQDVFGDTYLAPSGDLYFFSRAADGSQYGLWVSDGTQSGTRMLRTFADMGLSAIGPIAWVSGRTMFLNADDSSHQRGLFRLDLDTGTTAMITPNGNNSFAENAIEIGGVRFFIMDYSLWRSDGTPAGTRRLTNYSLPYTAMNPLVRVGDRLVFANGDPSDGVEIWVSDGTLAGTQMLLNTTPGSDNGSFIMTATVDRVFFVAGDRVGDNAQQFWVTDGTPGGTHLIPQAGGGTYGVFRPQLEASAVVGNRVFMNVDEPDPANAFVNRTTLWVTDLAGTSVTRVGLGGRQAQPFGNRVVYAADDGTGMEPWISDGMVAGTVRITDLAVSGQTGHSSPSDPVSVGNRAFFAATDNAHGRELFVTDGTAVNTRMVRDIAPGVAHGDIEPYSLIGVGDLLLFAADDDPDQYWLDQPWRSDGTAAGTFRLADVRLNNICGRWAERWNGRTWFFASQQYYGGSELWSTDGTAAGTRMEVALDDSIRNTSLCDLTQTSNGLVFAAVTFGGVQLWRSDGTPGGTLRLGNIQPAEPNGNGGDGWLTAVNGIAYFMADENPGSGRELWRTDGTASGTTLVTDLLPGPSGASAFGLTRFGLGVMLAYQSMDGATDGLYQVAGPSAAAVLVKRGNVTRDWPQSVGSKVFFVLLEGNTEALWVTDGTLAGSHSVITADAGTTLPVIVYGAGDGFLFMHGALNGNTAQIWATNGETGVHRLSNFTAPYDGIGYRLPMFRNMPLFVHEDLVTGSEPWIASNQAPVAVPDSADLLRDTSLVIPFRANDTDVDSAASVITESITTQPAHGTLTREAGGWRYAPTTGYTGSDFFEYQLTDELEARSAVTRVTITVTAPPPPLPPPPPPRKRGGGGSSDVCWLAMLALALALRRYRVRATT